MSKTWMKQWNRNPQRHFFEVELPGTSSVLGVFVAKHTCPSLKEHETRLVLLILNDVEVKTRCIILVAPFILTAFMLQTVRYRH